MKTLKELLVERGDDIVERWTEEALADYSKDAALFFKRETNPFSNPVGNALRTGTRAVFESLLEGLNSERICCHLEEIIKIRAIQDFSPSSAVSFVFNLKDVVRRELGEESRDPRISSELIRLDARIDQVALFAFDIFVRCREQLYALRIDEVKRSVASVFERIRRNGSLSEPVLDKREKGV